jgi:sensor histidine kinase YesM
VLDRATLKRSWRAWLSPEQCHDTPAWLQLLWTFLFSLAVAVLLTLLAWGSSGRVSVVRAFTWNFVIAQSIGFTIHLLFEIAGKLLSAARVRSLTKPQRILFFAGIPVVGCLLGYWIGLTLLGVNVARVVLGAPQIVVTIVVLSVILSTFWYRYIAGQARLAQAEADRERERTRVVELERQALDAQLRTLQAQIEPHFLFNTLANVVCQIDTAPANARLMLERLIDLLRASLAATRATFSTLGQEAALIAAYLDILQIRMGPRLRYSVDIPPALADLKVPPLSIQPLVENAIRHGLEPKLAGGTVSIVARAHDGTLQIDVVDNGLGFAPQNGGGVGLTNLRQRLTSLYGAAAHVTVEELNPGTRVRVVIPHQP